MPSAGQFRLYGLTLSSPFALPCPRVDETHPADVCLIKGTRSQFSRLRSELTAANTLDQWFWCKRFDDGSRYLRWDRLFEFLISPDGTRVCYHRLEDATPDSFTVYLLGPVLSFCLLARGVEPLHGTATVIDNGTILFLGNCGSGKSTLAAALLARGLPVLTDDVIAAARANGGWKVHPGVPRLKLFPTVARRLLGKSVREPRMNPTTSKLVLPLGNDQFRNEVTPLRAVYVLSPAKSSSHGVQIEALAPRDRLLELVGAAFNLVVVDRRRLANQFSFARDMASTVPIRRLSYARRFASLPAVHDALLDDLARIRDGASDARYVAGTATA